MPRPFSVLFLIVVARDAVIVPASDATLLETGVLSRRDRGHSGQVSREVLSGRARSERRALRWFQTESLCDACCWVRRKKLQLMAVTPSRWIARHITKEVKPCRL